MERFMENSPIIFIHGFLYVSACDRQRKQNKLNIPDTQARF